MIWHIFKKDWKLFRFHALLLALFELANIVVLILEPSATVGSGNGFAGMLHIVLPLTALAGGVALLVAICHQEAVPGVRQDWLVRPISRRDLVLSKILSILIMLHLPMLVTDVLYGLGAGFPFTQSVAAALSRNILILVTVSLPALAVASVSRGFSEVVAIILALAMIAGLFQVATRAFHWELATIYKVAADTGVDWVPTALGYGLVFIGIVAVLAIQYMRRKTFLARIVVGLAAIGFWMLVLFTPWKTAFAIESGLSSRSDAGNNVALSFDPTIGRLQRSGPRGGRLDYTEYIPLRVEDLPTGSIARVDLSDAYSVDELGQRKHFSRDRNLDLHNNGPNYLRLELNPLSRDPRLTPYNDKILNKPFQLEIELFITLLQATNETPLPGLLGPVANPTPKHICGNWYSSFGSHWEEGGDPDEGVLNVRCMPVIAQPPCVTLMLMNLPQPYVMRPSLKCYRDYSPHYGYLAPGGEAVEAAAYIRDPSSKDRFPDMKTTQVSLRWYTPVDHFKRKIVIPNMRLRDWSANK